MQKKLVKKLCLLLDRLVFLFSIYTGSFVSNKFFRSPTIIYKEACEENQGILERNYVQSRVCLMKQM